MPGPHPAPEPLPGIATGHGPTLDLNFMLGALDTRVSFSRGSTATYFDATGTLQTAAANSPRFDCDPATHVLKGLLCEESRTNSVRNPRAEGAVAGTPGTLPTYWGQSEGTGITASVIGTGTENGIPYIDVQFAGTATAGNNNIFYETTNPSASPSQAWTNSVYLRLVGGDWTNISSIALFGGDNIAGQQTNWSGAQLPTSAALSTQRYVFTYTTDAGAVTNVADMGFQVNPNAGAINVILRVGAPQFEQGPFPTSVILPPAGSPAPTTRNQDNANVALSGWWNPQDSTLLCEAMTVNTVADAGFKLHWRLDDGTGNNTIALIHQPNTATIYSNDKYNNGTLDALINLQNATDGVPYKAAIAVNTTALSGAMNGSAVVTQPSPNYPGTTFNRLVIGDFAGGYSLNGWMRHLRYWPRVLTNAELQQVTT